MVRWGGMETKTTKTWQGNPFLVILLLVFFYPIGLFLMWKYASWNKLVKIIVSAFFLLITIGIVSKPSSVKDGYREGAAKTTTTPSTTVAPVTDIKLVVTSQIVKKVNGKYRYFFDIRNAGTEDFRGTVTVRLFNNLYKSALASDTFDAKSSYIAPSIGKSVYIDANTGPVSEHGENGLTKFTYTISVDKKDVANGDGQITGKFENTDL